VIVTHGGTNSAQAAKAATTTIPIVFVVGVDPVATGLVRGLNQPGGNATGVSPLSSALGPKRLELLCELVPKASTVAVLVNPNNLTEARQTDEMLNAARMIGRQLRYVHASARIDFEKALLPSSNSGPKHSSSARTDYSVASASHSSLWRNATQCPPFTIFVNPRRPAV